MIPLHVLFITVDGTEIASFVSASDGNMDADTVQSFGDEGTFLLYREHIQKAGEQYFDIVTGDMLGPQSKVLDIGLQHRKVVLQILVC